MPGSLLETFTSKRGGHHHQDSVYGNGVGVTNNSSSARSDRSDGGSVNSNCSEGGLSNKKVSFNKAVRVKKYSNPPAPLSEANFWFKVHRPSSASSCPQSLYSSSEFQPSSLHIKDAVLLPQQATLPASSSSSPTSLQRPLSPPPPPPPPPLPTLPSTIPLNKPQQKQQSTQSNSPTSGTLKEEEAKEETKKEKDINLPLNNGHTSSELTSNGKPQRPLSTIIESDSIDCYYNNQKNKQESKMPRKETSSPISISKSRKIINYEPYKSPPKDSTILISPEDDGFRHEWITPGPPDKSLEFNDDNNNTKRTISELQSSPNKNVSSKSSRLMSTQSDTEYGKELPDDNVIITKKETKKLPLFKVKFGAKMKAVPLLPPLKSGKQSPTTSKKPKTITYSNDNYKDDNRSILSDKRSNKPADYTSDRDDRSKSNVIRSKSSSPDRSVVTMKRYSPVDSRLSYSSKPIDGPMSKSMIEVRRSDDDLELVEKKSPTTDVRLRDIKSEQSLANRMNPIAVWESGPMLLSDAVNRQNSSVYIPGEGRQMSTFEEGSKVWKHKTRRMYEEPIIGKHRSNSSPSPRRKRETIDYSEDNPNYVRRPTSKLDDTSYHQRPTSKLDDTSYHQRPTSKLDDTSYNQRHASKSDSNYVRRPSPKTDDDKLMITGDKLDEIFLKKESHQPLGNESDFFPYLDSYLPQMEDKACQCNLKKSKLKKISELSDNELNYDQGYRRIKSNRDGSVSAYSNVPSIDGDGDSMIDRSRRETPSRVHYHHPTKSEVIYSQVDKSKKMDTNSGSPSRIAYESDHQNHSEMSDYIYEANPVRDLRSGVDRNTIKRRNSPSSELSHRYVDRQRSVSPSESRRSNKIITSNTKVRNFASRSALDAPVIKFPNEPPWTREQKLGKSTSRSASRATNEPMSDDGYYVRRKIPNEKSYIASTLPRKSVKKPVKKEIIEETMSISDESLDDRNRLIKKSVNNNDMAKSSVHRTDSLSTNKGKTLPIKSDIVYENNPILGRRAQRNGYDNTSINSFNSWYKSLDEDYRKSANEPLIERGKDIRTLSRLDHSQADMKRDYSPVSGRNAYTLDRRQMDARKRNKRTYYPLNGSQMTGFRSDIDNASDRLPPSTSNMKKYSSNRDLSMHSDIGEINHQPKSNLAAAYQARQKRASSLNRYGPESDLMYPAATTSRIHHVPIHYGSHSQLNRVHYKPSNSILSENIDPMSRSYHGGSHTRLFQNEPISLYIPAVSNQDKKKTLDNDRSSGLGIGRAQSILSLSRNKGKSDVSSKLDGKKKGSSNASLNEITNKVNGYLKGSNSSNNNNNHKYRSGLHDDDEIVELRDADETSKKKEKKKLIKRSQSIPKDAKLPWFQKLKMKVRP